MSAPAAMVPIIVEYPVDVDGQFGGELFDTIILHWGLEVVITGPEDALRLASSGGSARHSRHPQPQRSCRS